MSGLTKCPKCHKQLAPGMFWVHEEDHEKGRILPKPILRYGTVWTWFGTRKQWYCANGKGGLVIGATPQEAYETWRTKIDY